MREEIWELDEQTGCMTTLGIRPAPQVRDLEPDGILSSLDSFKSIRGKNYEIEATFGHLSGNEKFSFGVRESPGSVEATKIIFDLRHASITIDRSQYSLEKLSTSFPNSGSFHLLPGEDLHVRMFLDNSILEVFANGRFAISSRIYPSLNTSVGASYDFGDFDERNVHFECWEGLKNAWPGRQSDQSPVGVMPYGENPTTKADHRELVGQH